MDYEELIEILKGFYGFITPSGEFIKISKKELEEGKTHYDLAIELIQPKELLRDININYIKDYLICHGYIAVEDSIYDKYIMYSKLTPANKWIENVKEILRQRGWKIDKIQDTPELRKALMRKRKPKMQDTH